MFPSIVQLTESCFIFGNNISIVVIVVLIPAFASQLREVPLVQHLPQPMVVEITITPMVLTPIIIIISRFFVLVGILRSGRSSSSITIPIITCIIENTASEELIKAFVANGELEKGLDIEEEGYSSDDLIREEIYNNNNNRLLNYN